MELASHRHFGRCHDPGSADCFTELSRTEEMARPCRGLSCNKEDEGVGFVGAVKDPGGEPDEKLGAQLTAFFTSAAMLASSAGVSSFSA
jgi:hypothetical protein